MTLTEYEKQRELRVARNKAMLQSTVTARLPLGEADGAGPSTKKQKKAKAPREPTGVSRRSLRLCNAEPLCYAEDKGLRGDRAPRRPGAPRRALGASKLTVEQVEAMSAEELAKYKVEGGINSGLGRRIQKTVEVKVVCTNTCCSIGRLPVLMCASCLANRHGEDVTAAIESGNWICPRCRDGCCGQGRHTKGADSSCIGCCNCSACRKKAKLEATGLIKHDAFRAGFSNAHDYLAGQKLGKTQEQMDDIRVARGWAHWSLDAAVRARAPALPAGAAPGPFVAGAAQEAPPAAPASPVQRDDHQADVSTDSAQPPAAAQHIGDDSSEDVPPGFAGVAPRVAVTVTDMFRAVRTPAEQMAILLKRKSETEATSSKRRIRK